MSEFGLVALSCVPVISCVGVGAFLDVVKRVNAPIVYFCLGCFGMFGTWALEDYLMGG